MRIKLDFRLLEVSLDINALDEYYKLIKDQITTLIDSEKRSLNEKLKKERLTPDDPEWTFYRQEYEYKAEFLLPRFFWGSFIVHVYAVFEISIIEISRLIRKKLNINIDINELKGDFPERAKKYFKNILNFELYSDNSAWQKIRTLADVRHVIAHANGRIDMLNDKSKKRIKSLERENKGISSYDDYVLIESHFAWETFMAVKSILEDLVKRYKKWDAEQNKV